MARVPLVCNCRRVVSRGDGPEQEFRVVKGRRWDCPSCGLDRKRTLADMCGAALASRMVTLTFEQPRVVFVGAERTPGGLPPGWAARIADGGILQPSPGPGPEVLRLVPEHIPVRHKDCDPGSHVAWNVINGGYRWRLMPDCKHCLRWISWTLSKWVRRMRRLYPGFDYLHAREIHKSGAVHLHLAVRGIPDVVRPRSKAAGVIAHAWGEVGGGFLHVGKAREVAGRDAGYYVGKYLAKQHENTFAKGFRRWSRSADFAPEIRMRPEFASDPDGWADPGAPLRLGGWVHPDGVERGHRWWQYMTDRRTPHLEEMRTHVRAPERSEGGLDSSTANPPSFPSSAVRMWRVAVPLAPETAPETPSEAWTALTLL